MFRPRSCGSKSVNSQQIESLNSLQSTQSYDAHSLGSHYGVDQIIQVDIDP